jgi:hypothetical protein
MSVASDGVVEVEIPQGDSGGFAVTSFGLELAEIARIAATLSVDARGIDPGDLLDPGGPFDGLELRAAESIDWYPWGGTVGQPDAWSYFVDTATNTWVQVMLRRPTPTEQLLTDLVAVVPVDVATLDPEELAGLAVLTERVADAGTLAVATDAQELPYHIVMFALPDGQLVTVTSPTDLADVLEVSAQLELATPDAWREAALDTMNGDGLGGDTSRPTVIGGGFSMGWTVELHPDWGLSIGGTDHIFNSPFDPVSGPTATAYRSIEHAYLVVTNTWPNDGLRVVVEQPGLEPQEADLRQLGDTPVYAAALQIDGDLPVTISWFALDGEPVDGPTSVP